MKFKFLILIIIFSIVSCRKGEEISSEFYNCNFSFSDSSQNNPNNTKYQQLLDEMVDSGVVGVTMCIYKPSDGLWLGTSGMADLHNNIKLKSCNITRVGSIVKMFTSVTILKLSEEGKINLDDKISDYLNGDIIDKIENADIATIRQLLGHKSGIYNYIQNLKFQTASLNDLIREWKAEDLLKYAYNQKAYFEPGEDVIYSNTNYILLGLLIEKIEKKELFQVFDEKIISSLNLKNTQFAGKNPVPDGIIRGYIDIYSNLDIIESTYYSGWDYYTADGGLISNPYDLFVFFKALMSGELINNQSLNEMMTWTLPNEADPNFYKIYYGLGIFKIETPQGIAYMHSGDAIGYYANMMYFPDDDVFIAYAVNSNYGKIDNFVSTKNAMQKIISTIK